ncbi:MAG: flagellar FliJ family protein [Calditrichaeota bacterium]|nr:flagellar FliJ family protein [Calditrichota bacterium]
MKKYRFSLDRVLRVRRIQQAMRLAEQKRAERALAAQEQRLAMFTGERDVQSEAMLVAQSAPFRVTDRTTDWRYLQRIERIVDYQTAVVHEHETQVDEASKRFLIARQGCLGLEKLEAKQRDAWFAEFLVEDQKNADDRPRKRPYSRS